MLRKISFCMLFVLMSCSSIQGKDGFDYDDLELSLEIDYANESVCGKLICKNKTRKKLRIPNFFLSFSADEIRENSFRNNWLEISKINGERVRYIGLYCDPSLPMLSKDITVLGKDEVMEIYIQNIDLNYDLPPGEKVSIKYYGPLGESNVVEFVKK